MNNPDETRTYPMINLLYGDAKEYGLKAGLLESDACNRFTVPIGRAEDGAIVELDLVKDPYLIVAGTTGSGKSSLIDVIITSLLIKNKPEEFKLILVDTHEIDMLVYKNTPL